MDRAGLFAAIRGFASDGRLSPAVVGHVDAIADEWGFARIGSAGALSTPATGLTPRIFLELADHEALVQEAYKDSVGVWTWAIGVTDASGHDVDRYKDNPQPLEKCIEVSAWLMREKYLPAVLKAFEGHALTEAQLGAALSFHYNTGAILKADWVTAWKAGSVATARTAFMNYRKPAEIIPRREKERDLFFDGKWSSDGKTTVYQVRKPSYSPDWGSAKRVDIKALVEKVLAA